MNRRLLLPLAAWVFLLLVGCGVPVETIEVTDYQPPPSENDDLVDDRIEDKHTRFDAGLVDSRPLDGWLINQSEAVVRLDVPLVKPDEEGELLKLYPSYKAACDAARSARPGMTQLPSVNLLDGKAKQFDDGLCAALHQAYFEGVAGQLESHVALVERLLTAAGPQSPAAPYLAAGLTLAGKKAAAGDQAKRDTYVRQFQANPAAAKPIGFYTWNDALKRCWAFLRFFQQELPPSDPAVTAIVTVLASDPALKADYERAAQFYGKLTNPRACLTPADLVGIDADDHQQVQKVCQAGGIRHEDVALFPPSSSRETELFERLFPRGLPANVNLMKELVRRIRSGEVDLKPRANSGWYDYQVAALETMLLPERGEEHDKLLLTRPYKKRMLEAFAALMTKRRETHILEAAAATAAAAPPQSGPEELTDVRPRLRVEPSPSYFLRTARSYAFLQNFLTASVGPAALEHLHGLRQADERTENLASELAAMRDLFYGLYLVSSEDIGQKSSLTPGEVAEPKQCRQAALAWLGKLAGDDDLGEDTRVAVPIYLDPRQKKMRLWVTLGVRLTKLDARFATAPRIKPVSGEGDWQVVEAWKLSDAEYLIAVDEFAEVEVAGLTPPTREELRKLLDQHQTKEAMIAALRAAKW
jgi:hypothetical protein